MLEDLLVVPIRAIHAAPLRHSDDVAKPRPKKMNAEAVET